MENEFQILKNVEENKKVTQRDIAEKTGMALGSVNILIKRLVKKGLLKVEKISPRTIRYILTPIGLKEKADITYRYILASYKYINEISLKIDLIFKEKINSNIESIVLFGEKDEIFELLQLKLKQLKTGYSYVKDFNEIDNILAENKFPLDKSGESSCLLIITWHPEFAEHLLKINVSFISLLDHI